VLYNFKGGSKDGDGPVAGLLNVNDALYGTTYIGGGTGCYGGAGCGTIFKVAMSGKETALHSFGVNSGDGTNPDAGLVNVEGTLYGTTVYGGPHCSKSSPQGCGTIFSLSP
jgi:uncharacterized repeat protein (TIGR03803 family)